MPKTVERVSTLCEWAFLRWHRPDAISQKIATMNLVIGPWHGLQGAASSTPAKQFIFSRLDMTVTQRSVDIADYTLNDIHIGIQLYTTLVAHAQATKGAPVFYSDILDQAKALDPHDAELQRAVPIGIGMKLLFVEDFCVANGYPNLSCLAVSRATSSPGAGYKGD